MVTYLLPRACVLYEQREDQYDGIDRDSVALIVEFCAQTEVAEATRHKYRTHLTEFARWLGHPRVLREGEPPRLPLRPPQLGCQA